MTEAKLLEIDEFEKFVRALMVSWNRYKDPHTSSEAEFMKMAMEKAKEKQI